VVPSGTSISWSSMVTFAIVNGCGKFSPLNG
jgi:hypothetical protein